MNKASTGRHTPRLTLTDKCLWHVEGVPRKTTGSAVCIEVVPQTTDMTPLSEW